MLCGVLRVLKIGGTSQRCIQFQRVGDVAEGEALVKIKAHDQYLKDSAYVPS